MRLHHRMRAFTCFLHGKFFLLRLPALYVETSVPKLPCPPLAYQGSIWVFPALPHFTHFDVVHVSQRIAGRGSNRVGTDPRSWACILPAGECSSVRLVATAVQFACVDARSGSSTSLGERPVLFLCETWTPQGSGCAGQKFTHWFLQEREPHYCNAMHAGSCQGKIRVARHNLYLCVRLQDAQHVGPDAAGDPGGTPHHLFFSIAFAFLAGCLPVNMRPRLSTRMCVCL